MKLLLRMARPPTVLDTPPQPDAAPEPATGSSGPRPSVPGRLLKAALPVLGTYAGLALLHRAQQARLPAPETLPKALPAEARTLECPAGRMNYYRRSGTGTPIVLVHSFNAAASSYEMLPIFNHLTRTTTRPVYAVDWLGFGRSARPDIAYTPDLYHDQLHQFVQDRFDEPVDVVALSLGSEYAAWTALQAAPRFRRLVLIAPTGCSDDRGPSTVGRFSVKAAARLGVFALLYYPLTHRVILRSFYERQVFLNELTIPQDLIDYAHATTHARGAYHAPRRFVDGTLFLPEVATSIYARLYRPTLMLYPKNYGPTVQRFDRLPDLVERNSRYLTAQALPGGLMPHWETPAPFFEALDAFLGAR